MDVCRSLTEPTLIIEGPVNRELPTPDGTIFDGLIELHKTIPSEPWVIYRPEGSGIASEEIRLR